LGKYTIPAQEVCWSQLISYRNQLMRTVSSSKKNPSLRYNTSYTWLESDGGRVVNSVISVKYSGLCSKMMQRNVVMFMSLNWFPQEKATLKMSMISRHGVMAEPMIWVSFYVGRHKSITAVRRAIIAIIGGGGGGGGYSYIHVLPPVLWSN
jgi:hypothetical protein